MKIPEDVGIQKQLTELHIQQWFRDDLFQPRWWILIVLILISVIVWWILVNKSRLLEIALYAAVAAVLFMGINEYGEELTLWDYPTDIIAIFPPLSSINMLLPPLLFSLLYQYYTSRKSFIIASLTGSVVLSLIIDPILSVSRLLELVRWKYYESIPVYFLAAVAVWAVVSRIYKTLEKHRIKLKQSM